MKRPPERRRRAPLLLVALTAAALLVACASGRPSRAGDDPHLKTEVLARLIADPQLNPYEIEVRADQGVITLAGLVDSAEQRQGAERIAAGVRGVRGVDNQVRVADPSTVVPDGTITAIVKAKIAASPTLNPLAIEVTTARGVVSLSGSVREDRERAEAERLARSTAGVRQVHNQLAVVAPAG